MPGPSAASFVLDLLRVAPEGAPRPSRTLVHVGELVGIKAGAIRAALSRLVAAGRIVQDDEGSYHLAPQDSARAAYVETWRRGEARRVPWSGAWWVVLTPKAPERTAHRRAERALSLVGFARAEPRLWTRPRNLAYERDELEALLAQLGLMDGAELFAASELSDVVERRWKKLWPVADLKRTYRRHAKALEKSMARLERIPRSRALAESFALGGEAIRILATDPMLPEEIQPAAPRVRLFDLMTEYDRIGRDLWQRTLREHGFE